MFHPPPQGSYAKGLAVEPRPVALARVRAAVEAIREMRQEGLDLYHGTSPHGELWCKNGEQRCLERFKSWLIMMAMNIMNW